VVVEEHPPSPCLVVEERPPSPKAKKRKSLVFVSTLPKRKTRSARFAEATVGWKNMEQALPILHPLSSVVNNVTVTQEPTSSPNLVVTQEPTAQEETVTQEPVMPELAVTQEPTDQEETVTQEPVMSEVVVTQEPVTQTREDNDDVPLAQLFSQIEKKIQGIENSRITELMKENVHLKAQLDSLMKDLQVAQQQNSENSTLGILAQATTVMNENREHMCYQCGDIYFQAGYKIVKVPKNGQAEEPTNFSVKTECDLTAPQKPVGQRRSQRNKVVVGLPTTLKQEPLLHLPVVTQATQTASVLKDKATQTDF
jgi:hypothetical protein